MSSFLKFRESSGFFVMILFLLLSLLWPEANKFDISERIDVWLIFGITSALFLLLFGRKKREFALFETLFLFGYLIFSTLSFIFSSTANYGFSEIYLLTSAVVIYFLLAHQPLRCRSLFYGGLIMLTALNIMVSMYRFFTHSEPEMAGLFFDPQTQAHFFPNAYALFLLMVWPLVMFSFIQKRRWWKFFLLIGAVSTLFLTFSRAALIVFLIQIALFLFLFRKKITALSLKYMAVGGVLCVLIVIGLQYARSDIVKTNSFIDKVRLDAEENITSYQERLSFWKGSIKLAQEKPWFGWGPYSFRFIYPRVQDILLGTSDHPHNYFLKILVERGVFALMFLLLFLCSVVWTAWKRFQNSASIIQLETMCLGIGLLGGLMHNMLDFNLNFLTNFLIFWILLAIFRSLFVGSTMEFPKTHFLALGLLVIMTVSVGIREGYLSLRYASRASAIVSSDEPNKIQALFKAYEKSFFPRDFYYTWARYYKDKIEPREVSKGIGLIKYHLYLNPEDARGWDLEGEMLRYMGEIFWSLEYADFKTALEKDFMNNFIYHYHFAEVMARRKELRDKLSEFKERVVPLLEKYEYFLERNIHFTGQTANPRFAILLYELLGREFPSERLLFEGKIEKLKQLQQ